MGTSTFLPTIQAPVLITSAASAALAGAAVIDFETETQGSFTTAIQDSTGWYLLLLVLALVGIIAQARERSAMTRTVQETWYAESR